MYTVYFLLLILVLVHNGRTRISDSDKLKAFLKQRCDRHRPNDYNNLKKNYKDFITYADYTVGLLPEQKRQFCNMEQYHLLHLMNILMDNFNTCLHEDEKYLSRFLITGLNHVLDFLCAANGRNIDRMFSNDTKKCLAKVEDRDFQDCLPVIHSRKKVLTEPLFCMALEQLPDCISDLFRTLRCKNSALANWSTDLLKRATCPCSRCPPLSGNQPSSSEKVQYSSSLLTALIASYFTISHFK